jgi:PmbA protein
MTAVFLPDTIYSLMWRLDAAASGRAFHEQISPLLERAGERVFAEGLTIENDPLNKTRAGARWFDDEGVPTQRLVVVENGVFVTPFVNLDYATKLGMNPTGTGFRTDRWGGDEITFPPMPALSHLTIREGEASLEDMVGRIERGVLVLGVLGAHSGNILNGDFSMGLNPGLYVENGKIRGRLKDAMIAGNVYEMMEQLAMIEDTIHVGPGGHFPSVAFENVNVSTRG